MKRVIVLVSGMDSLVAFRKAQLEYPNDEVVGVYFDLGTFFSKKEKSALPFGVHVHSFRGYLEHLVQDEIQGFRFYEYMFEGMIYDVIRSYHPDVLWLGVLFTDGVSFKDNRLDWIEKIDARFPKVDIDYPLSRLKLGKKEVIEYGISIGIEAQEMLDMWHCRSRFHGDYGCGSCYSCMRKKAMFEELGYPTQIPSPNVMPTLLLANEIADYANAHLNGTVDGDKFEFMQEVMPLLEKTYGVKDDVFALNEAIQANYEEKKHIIEDLMEFVNE